MKMTYEEAARIELYGDKNISLTSADVEALELAKDLVREVVCLEGKLAVQRWKNQQLSEEAFLSVGD